MERNKDAFWELIHEAKDHCGQDIDAHAQWLKDRLIELGPAQTLNFHNIMHGYLDLANKYGLWTAASVMCEYGCSDDGFIDFRAWLIAQGKEVYLAALKDPDSLANVPAYENCQYEVLSYVGEYAYSKLTGKSAYEAEKDVRAELAGDIVYGDGIGYPYAGADVSLYLPKLCKKYFPADIGKWNQHSPGIQQAMKHEKKSKRVTRVRGDAR